jgi:beta-alanine--pyruvate transaminase
MSTGVFADKDKLAGLTANSVPPGAVPPGNTAAGLDAFWMPFTANKRFKASPRMLVAAEGMYFTTSDGRKVIDGTAGLWCVNLGHGRRAIADAVHRQLVTLDYAPAFQLGHPIAFEFANRLADIAPDGLDRIFFTGSGSESNDTALKMALAYHRATGQGSRTRLIGRELGYHGVGFGGISVGGIGNNRRGFGALLPGVDHLRHTLERRSAFSRGQPHLGAELADDLERLVALHGAETIAAVVVEPVSGAGGVIVPPKGYLERLRQLCTQHGILLIFDEVITGFGRLGRPFGADYFGIRPDILCTAKGLTNGVAPMGAVFASREIHDAVVENGGDGIEFFHGYTYSGSPMTAAAGIASLDIYQSENLLNRPPELVQCWEDALHSLRGAPHVLDVRNLGLMGAVELAPRAGMPGSRGMAVSLDCFNSGAIVRNTGDTLVLSPPLIIESRHIDELVGIMSAAIARAA